MVATGTRRRFYQLRVWHGMTAAVWLGTLVRNRCRVSPSRICLVASISLASLFNSLLAAIQRLLFGGRIDRTELRQDPIFILGHWRSGTTLLHELLSLDRRHVAPSTYACLAPSHFLVSEKLLGPWLRFLLPQRRSQDNVRVGLERPQEDEWALCCLGVPTPYLAAAFPNDLPHAPEYFNLRGIRPSALSRWQERWTRFLRAVSLRSPHRRLVIKSPLHTARVDVLLKLFPEARFIHVVRDPRSVYPSTLRLWQRLAEDEGLQVPNVEGLDEFVLDNFVKLHASFAECRHMIRPERLCQIRYEDLVEDPVGNLRFIYDNLKLGGFREVRPAIELYAKAMSGFATNQLSLSAQDLAKVERRWSELIDLHGYSVRRSA